MKESKCEFCMKECPKIKSVREKLKEAEKRAEKAEKERDAAIKELEGVSSAVDDLDEFIDDYVHPFAPYDVYSSLRENVDAISVWKYKAEWIGNKEE